jgi:hypothetical protein
MKSKIIKIWGLVMVVAILAGLLVVPAIPVSAGNLIFTNLALPTGINGQFTQGTSVSKFAFGIDGKTAFAYSNNMQSSTLASASTAGATSITVANTDAFANSGFLTVAGEIISYTAKTKTGFSGIPSSTPNNLIAGHSIGDAVTQTGQIFKSMDGGITWNNNGYGTGLSGIPVVGLAISPQYATDTTVIVATGASTLPNTSNNIYRSTDGGANFAKFTPSFGPTPPAFITNGSLISSVDIAQYYLGGQAILVGYSNGAGAGGAALFVANTFTWTDLTAVPGWTSPGPTSYDVIGVAFSPKYSSDSEILVVAQSNANTYLRSRIGTNNWDADVGAVIMTNDQSTAIPAVVGNIASLTFPNDYDWSGNNRVFVGLGNSANTNSAGLDAYRINGQTGSTTWTSNPISQSRSTDLNIVGTGANNAANVSDIAFGGPLATGTLAVALFVPTPPSSPLTTKTTIYSALGASGSPTFVSSNFNTQPFSGGGMTQLAFAPTAAAGKPYVLYVGTQSPVVSTENMSTFAWSAGSHSALFMSTDYMNYAAMSLISVSSIRNLVPSTITTQGTEKYMTVRDQRNNLANNQSAVGQPSTLSNSMTTNDLSMIMKSTDGTNFAAIFSYITNTNEYLSSNTFSPTFATDNVIYNTQTTPNQNRIWKSTDRGTTWASFNTPNSIFMSAFALIDANTYYVGAGAASGGGLYKSGIFTSIAALDGKVPFSITLGTSPTIGDPNVIFIATASGEVYYSSDAGVTFTNFGGFGILGNSGTNANNVTLVLDPNYKTNKLIYATGQTGLNDPSTSIFRWTVGTSTSWETMSTLGNTNFPMPVFTGTALVAPASERVTSFSVAPDGTMYLVVSDTAAKTAQTVPPVFYRVNNPTLAATSVDLNFVQMSYQQISGFPTNGYVPFKAGDYPPGAPFGGQFASIQAGPFVFGANVAGPPPITANEIRFMINDGTLGINLNGYPYQWISMTDNLVAGPAVTRPTANAQVPTGTTFTWAPVPGATGYRAQLATDAQFQGLYGPAMAGLNTVGDPTVAGYYTGATSITVPTGTLNPGTTYYFRVQTVNPLASKFSAPVSFAVLLAQSGNSLSGDVPGLYGPTAGSTNVPVKPVFQWADVQGAQSYDLQVADNPVFVNPLDAQTGLNTTVWTETKTLDPGKTYYWRVRAVAASGTASNWLNSSFTTALSASATQAPPAVVISTVQAPPVTITQPALPAQTVTVTPPAKFFDQNSGLYFNSQSELSAYQAAHPQGAAPSTSTPAYIWVIIVIGAILVIAVIVLITRTRRV